MHLEAQSGPAALSLDPSAEAQRHVEGLRGLGQHELPGPEYEFVQRLRPHPFIGILVESYGHIDIRYLRERGSPEHVVKCEVDSDTEVVEICQGRDEDEPSGFDLFPQLEP